MTSYASLERAKSVAQSQLLNLATILEQPDYGHEDRRVDIAKAEYLSAKEEADAKQTHVSEQLYANGISEKCDMGCVKGCGF